MRRIPLAVVALLLARAAPAGAVTSRDAEALALCDAAMSEDYPAARLSAAEAKLRSALATCGFDRCAARLIGEINVALAVVYGAGAKDLGRARRSFDAALEVYPGAALRSSFDTPELSRVFREAQEAARAAAALQGDGVPTREERLGEMSVVHVPPREQLVDTPIPLYVEPTRWTRLSRVELVYKPFGATKYRRVDLTKVARGFGDEIPCGAVSTVGPVRYFFKLFDAQGKPAGTSGSALRPYKVPLKNDITGDPPALPGEKAPRGCHYHPPALGCEPPFLSPHCPGYYDAEPRVKTTCRDVACPDRCKEGICLPPREPPGRTTISLDDPHHFLSFSAGIDLAAYPGADHVCSPGGGPHACFYEGSNTQVVSPPAPREGTDSISSGFRFAHVRLLLGYDLDVGWSTPVMFGARLGVALPSSPAPANAPPKDARVADATFLSIHAELRASWAPFSHLGSLNSLYLNPYVFVSGGLAQVSPRVPARICATAAAAAGSPCDPSGDPRKGVSAAVDVYPLLGRGFVAIGGGCVYGLSHDVGVFAELKMMFLVPAFGVAVAPSIGPIYKF